MAYMGDLYYDGKACLAFNSRGTDGALATATGLAAVVYRNDLYSWFGRGVNVQSTAGITITTDVDGIVGFNSIEVDMDGLRDFYVDRADYRLVLTAGTAGGTSYAGQLVGTWSLGRQKDEPTRVLSKGPGG